MEHPSTPPESSVAPGGSGLTPGRARLKRWMDLIGAGCTLALLAPAMALVALAILATSGVPVLFRQQRVGQGGRPFTLYKFRTMVRGAEEGLADLAGRNEVPGPVFKMRRDPRVTSLGLFLRYFSVDELPQLFNVLVGDMSLVGPRPALPGEVAHYRLWQRRRLAVMPGMTGTWQVSGRAAIPFDRWVEMDLAYIDSWSIAQDLVILLRTIPAVVFPRGAW